LGRHIGLIEKDSAKVFSIGKDVFLVWQIRTSTVDQVDAGKFILLSDFLSAEMLLYGDGVISTPFHGTVIGDNYACYA
jgi:hypothetical protein